MSHLSKINQVSVPLVYGTISFWLGKKADDQNTHRWVVYVRGHNNEDLSYIIDRVVFNLHPSFKNPTRTISSFPFEVHESGWGEFEILIKIFFKEDVKESLDVFHNLKLYHTNPNASHSTKKPVVSEFYDEVIFLNPSDKLVKLLRDNKKESNSNAMEEERERYLEENKDSHMTVSAQESNLLPYYLKFDDKAQKQLLEDACAYVDNEVEALKRKISEYDSQITRFQQNLK